MYRNVRIKAYKDIIPDSGAKSLEELRDMLRESIEESKKLKEWPDPEEYR